MSNNTAENDSQSRPEEPGPAAVRASRNRRRLLGGMVGAPIVALVARPALANPCTVSGANSAAFASHSSVTCTPGHHPSYWASNTTSWPSGYTATGTGATTFKGEFGSGPNFHHTSGITLYQVVANHQGSSAAHYVAALLNAASVNGYPYSPSKIKKLWNDPTLAGQGQTIKTIANFFKNNLE